MNELLATPTTFADFAVKPDKRELSDPLFARYRLSCKICGHERFIMCEAISGEDSVSGVEATCGECGHTASAFYAFRDGYDGRLGHNRFLEAISARGPLKDDDQNEVGESLVACGVSYSIEPEELISIGAEAGLAPQDLFDWFYIFVADGPDGPWRCVWDYECA